MIADPDRRRATTKDRRRATTKDRRARLRAANKCINGPLVGDVGKRSGVVHGPVVARGRCQRCLDVDGRGKAVQP